MTINQNEQKLKEKLAEMEPAPSGGEFGLSSALKLLGGFLFLGALVLAGILIFEYIFNSNITFVQKLEYCNMDIRNTKNRIFVCMVSKYR